MCIGAKQFSALRFSLPDQLFHPWVQSAALADGSGRADTYYHLMEGEDGGGSKRSEGNGGTHKSGRRDEGGIVGEEKEGNPVEGTRGSERGS